MVQQLMSEGNWRRELRRVSPIGDMQRTMRMLKRQRWTKKSKIWRGLRVIIRRGLWLQNRKT
jgi:hypothetical protein